MWQHVALWRLKAEVDAWQSVRRDPACLAEVSRCWTDGCEGVGRGQRVSMDAWPAGQGEGHGAPSSSARW